MNGEVLRKLIVDALGDDVQREGMALYSSLETLKQQSRFYMLGYNPADRGGNYTQLFRERFKETTWHAYYDQCWHLDDEKDCGCVRVGNLKTFQKRAQRLIQALHDSDDPNVTRSTVATNAIFLASGDPGKLGSRAQRSALWDRHWIVHRTLLTAIRPDFIVALGCGELDSPYALLREKLIGTKRQTIGSSWKAFKVSSAFCQEIGKREPMVVVGLYHPSRFGGQDAAWHDFHARWRS